MGSLFLHFIRENAEFVKNNDIIIYKDEQIYLEKTAQMTELYKPAEGSCNIKMGINHRYRALSNLTEKKKSNHDA